MVYLSDSMTVRIGDDTGTGARSWMYGISGRGTTEGVNKTNWEATEEPNVILPDDSNLHTSQTMLTDGRV